MSLYRRIRCSIVLCCLAAGPAVIPARLEAQAPQATAPYETIELAESSLRFADAEASFFSVSYQLKSQWEAFLDGPFVTHLRQTDVAQRYEEALRVRWENREGPLGQLRGAIENENLASLLDLLGDMVDEEVFFYGGKEWPETVVGLNNLFREFQVVIAAGDSEAAYDYYMSLDPAMVEAIRVPTTIFGGKITDRETALQKIDELNGILQFGLSQSPQTRELLSALQRTEDDRGTRIQLTLTESMIPWEQIPTNGNVQVEDAIEHAQELIAGRQITITIGLLDEFLIFAVSETPEEINQLGSDGGGLLERPEMELVREHADEPVLAVTYQSDAMVEASYRANFENYFSKNFRPIVVAMQNQLSDRLTYEDDEEEIAKIEATLDLLETAPDDLQWVDDQIAQHIPDLRGSTSVALAADDGVESWTHYRTASTLTESAGELPVLKHLGDSPYFVFAGRKQSHPEYFETVRQIAGKVRSYLERISDSSLFDGDEEASERLNLFLERGWPLLVKLGDIIEEDFIPATADGQFAFVMNPTALSATQLGEKMPPASEPLPIPSLAKVVGVSDREKLLNGFERLHELADEAAAYTREIDPEAIPEDYFIIRPLSEEVDGGQIFYYDLREKYKVPEGLTPAGIFTDDFAYYGYSRPQLESLLKETDFQSHADFIEQSENVSGICYFDVGRLFAELRPWVRYATERSRGEVLIEPPEDLPTVSRGDVMDLYEALMHSGEWMAVRSDLGEQGTLSHVRYFEAAQ